MNDLRTAAQAVIDRWDSPDWSDGTHTRDYINTLRQALADTPSVDALIAEAVATEREACAQMVENLVIFHPGSADKTLDQCAEAIRARGQK